LVQGQGFSVGNVDATMVCQRPKLAAHIPQMRAYIAADLAVELDAINIKATTTEQLGYTGRGEGIAAHAVVLIQHV
jgi:2-C-methyl-D-erythritol 2,4-cyclodiphosphate synthase